MGESSGVRILDRHSARAILWKVSGPLLTLAAAITIEVLSQTWLQIPNPPAILLLIVVFSAFTGGLPSGLASAVIAWLYFAYFFSTPRGSFGYTDENARRVIVWAITTPAMALMVGILKRRADWAQAGRARRESEARKGAILEAALDCIISIDHEVRVIDFNPAAEQTFGYTRAQIVGKEMRESLTRSEGRVDDRGLPGGGEGAPGLDGFTLARQLKGDPADPGRRRDRGPDAGKAGTSACGRLRWLSPETPRCEGTPGSGQPAHRTRDLKHY